GNTSQAHFPIRPGETPRAHGAFIAFFQLGPVRSLPMLSEKLGESLGTIKNWSSRYDWTERIQSFNSGFLQQQAETQRQQAADWAKRINEFREQEWNASQKLLAAARCFLESYGEEELRKMTLAQVSRALDISSRVGRLALNGTSAPDQPPAMSQLQTELAAALKRMYEPTPPVPATAAANLSTTTSANPGASISGANANPQLML
ncbi:MAG: hypothetical protein ACXWDN_15670, partial [Limisphaerales bacterium]